MRKPIACTAIMLMSFFVGLGVLPAAAQIGFAAGLNFESLSDIEALDVKSTFDNASGYHAGIFFDMNLGLAGVRIGAFYRDLGEFDATNAVDEELEKVDLAMIDFPVDFHINLGTAPAIQPYILVGPVFSLPSSGNDSFDGTLESLLISGNVGLGIALNVGGIRLFPEVRYAVGISRLIKDDASIGGTALQTDDTRINSAMLRLGVAF